MLFWVIFFVFVRLLEGTGGRDGGREKGGFFLANTDSLTILTDLVPFPLYRFSSGKRTLPKGKRTLPGFSQGNDSFPYILDEFRAISYVS